MNGNIEQRINKLIQQDKRNKEMARLRADGMKLSDIAKMFGLTRQRIHQILGNTGYTKSNFEKAVELANPELTVEELAEIAGVSYSVASNAFSKSEMRHSVKGSGSVKKGFNSENAVCSILECAGFHCEKQTFGANFDILINDIIKVDVKSAYKPKTSPSMKNINPTYRFKCTNGKQADFYIFYIVETNDVFIVPVDAVKSDFVVFAWPTARPKIGKYQKFYNRFDLLWKAIDSKKAAQAG